MARHRNPVLSYVLHKQSGRARLIWTDALGTRQQKLLPGPFGSAESLTAKARLELEDATDYLFSPARAVAELRAQKSLNRKTPRYPSHMRRNATKRKSDPKRRPAAKYSRGSYEGAVDRACDAAFPPRTPLVRRADETVKAWQNRLRTHPVLPVPALPP